MAKPLRKYTPGKGTWQQQLLRGRYRRIKQVPPIHLRKALNPAGTWRKLSPYPSPKMDRGLLNVAVLAYGNVQGMSYDVAHAHLSSLSGADVAPGQPA